MYRTIAQNVKYVDKTEDGYVDKLKRVGHV
jgi:hypothetical protein